MVKHIVTALIFKKFNLADLLIEGRLYSDIIICNLDFSINRWNKILGMKCVEQYQNTNCTILTLLKIFKNYMKRFFYAELLKLRK